MLASLSKMDGQYSNRERERERELRVRDASRRAAFIAIRGAIFAAIARADIRSFRRALHPYVQRVRVIHERGFSLLPPSFSGLER